MITFNFFKHPDSRKQRGNVRSIDKPPKLKGDLSVQRHFWSHRKIFIFLISISNTLRKLKGPPVSKLRGILVHHLIKKIPFSRVSQYSRIIIKYPRKFAYNLFSLCTISKKIHLKNIIAI